MTQTVLHIDASVATETSRSRAASKAEVAAISPSKVIRRDLVADPLPFIDNTWAEARLKPRDTLTDADKSVLALSDKLVAELQAADTIVIGMPIYNFAAPASLKAWMDLVARPKVTFHYTENGPEGLLAGKKAVLAVASGGVPVGSDMDFASRHLTHFLNFIGISDVTVLDVKDLAAAA